MLSVVKNVEFCSLFFCRCPTNRDFEDHLETDFGIEDSENRLRSDHVHAHVDDHVLVIVVVDVNVIVVVDGFVSQPGDWNRVRHE